MYSYRRGRGNGRNRGGGRRQSFGRFERRDYGGSSRDNYDEQVPAPDPYDRRDSGLYDNPRKRVRDQRDSNRDKHHSYWQDEPGPSATDSDLRKERPPPHLRGKDIEIRKGFDQEGSRNRRVDREPVGGYKVRRDAHYHSPYDFGGGAASVCYDSQTPSTDAEYWERRKKELDRSVSNDGGEENRYFSDDELSSDESRDGISSTGIDSCRTSDNSYKVPVSPPPDIRRKKKRVKPIRVFIRNLPMDFLKEHIVHELTMLGFKVRAVNRWKVLKIYQVQLTPTYNVMDVFKIKQIKGISVSVVEPKTLCNKPKFLNQVLAGKIPD